MLGSGGYAKVSSPSRNRWWKVTLSVLGVLVLGALALEGFIVWPAWHLSVLAAERFPGDRVEALIDQVECTSCGLRQRQDAVWALGQIGDRRALPALRAHLTGRRCDHAKELCQYELQKAIRHIEKGIPLHSVLRIKP